MPIPSENEMSLARQVREDWEAHHQDWTAPGFRAVAVHRFGAWVNHASGRGLVRGPIQKALSRLYVMMFRYVRNHYGIEIMAKAVVGRRVFIAHQSGIVNHFNAVIGDECIIRQNVTIGALNTQRPLEAPTLGRGVEIGAGAVILGAVTIGDGARIGPNTVVMADVPAGATVFVGSPRMIMPKKGAASDDEKRESCVASGAR